MKLRPPAIPFERLKLTIIIVGLLILSERSSPLPFATQWWAKFLVFSLILEVVRQTWVYFLEISRGHVARSQTIRERWDGQRERLTVNTRWRIRRFLITMGGLWMFGFAMNGVTTRCNDAIQCVMLFPQIMLANMPDIFRFALMMMMALSQIFAMFYAMTKVGTFQTVLPGTLDVSFDEVWGQDKAKARVMEQIELLEHGDKVEAAGGYMPKGLLLWGPPGTGKTFLAKAAATTTTKPLVLVPPGAFQATFVGINLLKISMLGRTLRKLALRYDGVLCFLDEIDSLGNRGAEVADQARDACTPHDFGVVDTSALPPDQIIMTGGGGQMGTLEAFLAMLDGFEKPRGLVNKLIVFLGLKPLPAPKYRVLFFGATNLPQKLDKALTRAGRFGRKIHVPYPDYDGRRATFRGYIDKVPNEITEEQLDRMARDMTRGTGAEIKDVVNEALLLSAREDDSLSVTSEHMLKAMLWTRFGEPLGQQEVEEDRWSTAVHEAGHAVAAIVLRSEYERIWFGSVEKRGQTGGMIASSEVAERPFKPRRAMLANIAVGLASGEAEKLEFGESTSGMGGDQRGATAIAKRMVSALGMGNRIQTLSESQLDSQRFDEEVEAVLIEAQELARRTLESNREALIRVAELLVDRGTVWGSEIEEAYNAEGQGGDSNAR